MKIKTAFIIYVALLIYITTSLFSNIETAQKTSVHTQNNFNFYGEIASNYNREGLVGTKLGMIYLGEYYVHHPPLLPLMVATSFKIADFINLNRIIAANLVPTLFTIGSILFLFLITSKLWGDWTALVTIFIVSITPIFKRYSQHVNHEPLVTFFILSSLYYYIIWIKSDDKICLRLVYISMILGCLSGWPMYYLMAILPIHHMLYKSPKNLRISVSFYILACIMFVLFLIHIYILDGSNALIELTSAYEHRESNLGLNWTLITQDTLINGNTEYLCLASLLFLPLVALKLIRKTTIINESYVILLLMIAVIHNIWWQGGVIYHDYWIYYFTIPMALGATVTAINIVHLIKHGCKKVIGVSL